MDCRDGDAGGVQESGTIFLLFLQREATDAEEFENVTLAIFSASLVKIGCELVVRLRGCGASSSARARGSAPVQITNWRATLPPSPSGGHSGKWGGHMSNLAMSS